MIASINFYPNLTKKNERINLIPIYIRVAFKRAKSESRLNVSINETDLSKWDPVTMRMLEKNSTVNLYLNNIQKQFNDFIILNATELPKYSARQIKEYVLGVYESKDHVTMIEFVDSYFNKTILNNVNCTAGTMKNYRWAVNHLKAYLKHTQQENLFQKLH